MTNIEKVVAIIVLLLVIVIVGIIVFVIGPTLHLVTTDDQCRADCELSGGEFVRVVGERYAEIQCVCLIDGEVRNIW